MSDTPDNLHTAPQAPLGRPFEILMPVEKSYKRDEATGAYRLKGCASDQKRDLDGEIVKAANMSSDAFSYLERAGVFNLDHHPDIVGKVEKARVLDIDTAKRVYGPDIEGTPIEVEGWVHPITQHAPEDLKRVHHLIETGHPLYFSIQGTVGSRTIVKTATGENVPVTTPGLINAIAITAQPKNINARCHVVKSLADLLVPPQRREARREDGEANNLQVATASRASDTAQTTFVRKEEDQTPLVLFLKSMEVTGTIAGPGSVSGDAIKTESLDGAVSNQSLGGKKSKKRITCPNCGKSFLQKSITEMVGDLLKARSR